MDCSKFSKTLLYLTTRQELSLYEWLTQDTRSVMLSKCNENDDIPWELRISHGDQIYIFWRTLLLYTNICLHLAAKYGKSVAVIIKFTNCFVEISTRGRKIYTKITISPHYVSTGLLALHFLILIHATVLKTCRHSWTLSFASPWSIIVPPAIKFLTVYFRSIDLFRLYIWSHYICPTVLRAAPFWRC